MKLLIEKILFILMFSSPIFFIVVDSIFWRPKRNKLDIYGKEEIIK